MPYVDVYKRQDYLAGHADCALTLVSGKDGEMEVLKEIGRASCRERV